MLSDLSADQLASASPLLDAGFYDLLRDGAWLESKVSRGGTSLAMVRHQLERAQARSSVRTRPAADAPVS